MAGVTVGAANADPVKALQAVSVTLGSDGTVQGIASKLISKGSQGSTSTSNSTFDPAKWGSTLPIRVQTAYIFGSRQGTNLADLAGKSGHFVITLTVENTTAKPTVIHYDGADGNQHTDYALVGTPMTVLATADAGSGNIAHVVTAKGATSGVLSQAPNGHALVQYAAMLAPPQLAASTTFTLVENSTKFSVPSFSIAAEPGLVTDASTLSLLQSAFGANGATVQKAAIDTISSADSAMQYALSQMNIISATLANTTGNLGVQTVARLKLDSATLATKLQSVGSQIDASAKQIAVSLSTAQSTATTTIAQQIGAVQSLLVGDPNDPSSQVVPTLTTSPGCGAPLLSSVPTNLTVLQQAKLLNEWFSALASANSACSDTIQAGIAAMIGTQAQATAPASECATPPASNTLVCALRTSQDAIQQANASLDTQLKAINGTYNPLSLQDLGVQYATKLLPAVQGLQADAASLTTSNHATQNAVAALVADQTGLDAAWAPLDPNGATYPYTAFDNLAKAVDSTTGTSPSQLQSDIDKVCQDAAADPTPTTGVSTLCDSTNSASLHAEVAGWATAIKDAATQWTTTTKPALTTLGSQISTIDADIAAVVAATTPTTPSKSLKTTVATLVTDIGNLYDSQQADPMNTVGGVVPPTCSQDATAPSTVSPLNALSIDSFNAICNATSVTAGVSSAWDLLDNTVKGVVGSVPGIGSPTPPADTVDSTISRLLNVWLPATNSTVNSFFTDNNTNLLGSQSAANTESQNQINAANANLQKANTDTATLLGQSITNASATITTQLNDSTSNVSAANTALAASFAHLLVALGGGNTGLLGTMSTSARDTVAQAGKLGDTASATQSGNSIQQLGLDGTTRDIAELRASVDQGLAAFGGVSVPDGSSVLPVFTFAIGGN